LECQVRPPPSRPGPVFRASYAVPTLGGGPAGHLFGNALLHLCAAHDNGDTVAQLAALFAAMAQQITATTHGAWVASQFACVDGSRVFVGMAISNALAITASRGILTGRGQLGPGELVNLSPVAKQGQLVLPAPDAAALGVRIWR
jgi:hypothetical protein